MTDRLHLSPRQLLNACGAVAAGGAIGTILRDLALKLQPVAVTNSWVSHIPWTLIAINAVGVFLATVLLRGPLRHREPSDVGRLVLITGFFGGFTSYSSLYVALSGIWRLNALGACLTLAGALLSGLVAAWAGMKVTQ